jgi:hypothetical protein
MPDTYTEDEISLTDILIFLQDSISNVFKSVLACVILGGAYYFSTPKLFEASVTIQMAMATGTPVEAPGILLEKLKLPLYFSQKVWRACDTDEDSTPSRKVAEKIKPTLNKSAPFIGFSVQAQSVQEAKECLNAVIFEIAAKQAELAKPILDQKRVQIAQLEEKLKLAEETAKTLTLNKLVTNFPDSQFASKALVLATTLSNSREIKDLTNQINDAKVALEEPQTKATSLASKIYAPEFAVNKRPVFTLGLSVMLGIFMGFLVTGLMKIWPSLRKRLANAKEPHLPNS